MIFSSKHAEISPISSQVEPCHLKPPLGAQLDI
ncbi:unnamed protein product, partial [marine sediment metagenome]